MERPWKSLGISENWGVYEAARILLESRISSWTFFIALMANNKSSFEVDLFGKGEDLLIGFIGEQVWHTQRLGLWRVYLCSIEPIQDEWKIRLQWSHIRVLSVRWITLVHVVQWFESI